MDIYHGEHALRNSSARISSERLYSVLVSYRSIFRIQAVVSSSSIPQIHLDGQLNFCLKRLLTTNLEVWHRARESSILCFAEIVLSVVRDAVIESRSSSVAP